MSPDNVATEQTRPDVLELEFELRKATARSKDRSIFPALSAFVLTVLGGVLAVSSWTSAWAQNNEAARPASPQQATAPRGETPQPSWPELPKAPAGAPNVVLILVDDVGFGATSTFGGPVSTPNLDRLAQSGLRYNSFHMPALCSPTRAALLTGRNNHQVGFGSVAEWSSPYPGYNTMLPKNAATIAEVLKENGYSTSAFGKWHNTPMWQVSPAGPFDRWPTGLGFEYFYGFNQAEDSQYYTRIYRDTTPIEPPKTPEQGYHFTTDITNEAITGCISTMGLPATNPSSSTTRPARRIRRIRFSGSGLRSTRASSTKVGM